LVQISDALPVGECLAFYVNQCKKGRIVRAIHYKKHEIESMYDDDWCVEYSEENDTYYIKEGWYELIDNCDDYKSVRIIEGIVSHWMKLPDEPTIE
jgi:hypothetical protein